MSQISATSSLHLSTASTPSTGVIALNRMGFGPRPGDLDSFNALGSTEVARLNRYIDQQLDPQTINDSELQTRISAAGFKTLNKSFIQLWDEHFLNYGDDYAYRILPFRETERLTFLRAAYSRRQLVEVMADFWHNHFNIYGLHFWAAAIFMHHDRDIIRKHLFGNFRDFLEEVTKSTAMLTFLDNYKNSNAGPNENHARELFEIHTMGAQNYFGVGRQDQVPVDSEGRPVAYVDDDVYEAARCLTGWTISNHATDPVVGNTGEFYYRSDWHDRFQKHVLGSFFAPDQADLVDGQQLLDLLASHPGTARHIAFKLCRRLISDNPPEDIVNSTAELFHSQRNSPTQLKKVLRHILRSPEFRNTWGEKTKRPFEVIASAFRATATDFTLKGDDSQSLSFMSLFNQMGQPLMRHRSPDGYSDTQEHWLNTTTMVRRWRLLNWLTTLEDSSGNPRMDILAQTPTNIRSATALADFWLARVFGRTTSNRDRRQIIDFMAQRLNPDLDLPIDTDTKTRKRLSSMVALILMSPEFQWR